MSGVTDEARAALDAAGPFLTGLDDPNVALLRPPLREALVELPSVGLAIKHPWVNLTFGIFVGQANELFDSKARQARILLDPRNRTWRSIDNYLSFVVERPWRVTTLERFWRRGKISRKQLRRILPGIWTDAEMPTTILDDPSYLWREVGFATDDPGRWERLGDPIVAYRGGPHGGISWTIDAERALWFGMRFVRHPLWRTTVRRTDVLGFLTGRGESELILDPQTIGWHRITRPKLKAIADDLGPRIPGRGSIGLGG